MANMISSINLCSVPILPTHQIDFADKAEQLAYFNAKKMHGYYPCKYIARSGSIRVKAYVEDLNDCNYGFYTNYYNGVEKTFFFWVVQKVAIARQTTLLTIQLDVFQTWMFDYEMKPCFVDRMHVFSDSPGQNTMPEDFELGDYVARSNQVVSDMQGNPAFFVAVTDSESGNIGGIFGKTYSGFALKYFKYTDRDQISTYIKDLCNAGKGDSIAFIFAFPDRFLTQTAYWSGFKSGDTLGGIEGTISEDYTFSQFQTQFMDMYQGYTPRNNKLYTYPYNFLTVQNSNGSNVVLKFENFKVWKDVKFKIEAVMTQNPLFTLTPYNYAGKSLSYEDSIHEQSFGLCSWNNDNYANWYANNQNSIRAQSKNADVNFSTAKSINKNNYSTGMANNYDSYRQGQVSNISNLGTGINNGIAQLGNFNILGAVAGVGNATIDYTAGTVNNNIEKEKNDRTTNNDLANAGLLNTADYQNTIRTLMGSISDAAVQPNSCKGDTGSCGLDLARNNSTFRIYQSMIKAEYAKKIDMYFQMYGYKLNSICVPSIKSRSKWNYIKTVGAICHGNVPLEDRQMIESFYNNGFTVWHSEADMFNYDRDNSIVTNN